MESERLKSLLRQRVLEGPREPSSPDCLRIQTVLRLLDAPEDARPEDLEHLAVCRYCQRSVALARQERAILEAPWSGEESVAEGAEPGTTPETAARDLGARPQTIKLARWFARWPAVTGIAAMVVLAVGLSWWATRARDSLGRIEGRFVPIDVTRGDEEAQRKYRVEVELNSRAWMTFLYLDHTRELQVPVDAAAQAADLPPGPQSFDSTITTDPPGPQWIAAVASAEPFNPLALRDELQATIAGLPQDAPFDDLIARLEEALRERQGLSFRGHRFEVPEVSGP